ncbi:MAG: hypothetical protein HQK51_16985 [Oligoflexia bacterium]|nr:hypothetical protein [Oligoflexia bacterium]
MFKLFSFLFYITLICSIFSFAFSASTPSTTAASTSESFITVIEEDQILKFFFRYPEKVIAEKMKTIGMKPMLPPSPDSLKELLDLNNKLFKDQNAFIKNFYENTVKAKNILYLGDYPDLKNYSLGLAIKTAPLLPQTNVYLSDIVCPITKEESKCFLDKFRTIKEYIESHNNLKIVNSDHNKKLPFDDNSFDSIIMQAGLCFCSPTIEFKSDKKTFCSIYEHTCGGLAATKESYKRFSEEIVRILNKKNKNAFALLEGLASNSNMHDRSGKIINNISLWESVFLDLKKEYPFLKFEILVFKLKNLKTEQIDTIFKGVRIGFNQ